MAEHFDVVIVRGGEAGGVVAACPVSSSPT